MAKRIDFIVNNWVVTCRPFKTMQRRFFICKDDGVRINVFLNEELIGAGITGNFNHVFINLPGYATCSYWRAQPLDVVGGGFDYRFTYTKNKMIFSGGGFGLRGAITGMAIAGGLNLLQRDLSFSEVPTVYFRQI